MSSSVQIVITATAREWCARRTGERANERTNKQASRTRAKKLSPDDGGRTSPDERGRFPAVIVVVAVAVAGSLPRQNGTKGSSRHRSNGHARQNGTSRSNRPPNESLGLRRGPSSSSTSDNQSEYTDSETVHLNAQSRRMVAASRDSSKSLSNSKDNRSFDKPFDNLSV